MKTEIFNFDLPVERIAITPCAPRDAARLLCIHGNLLTDSYVNMLDQLLRPNDVLIFNDTKVIPARLFGIRDAARVEVTLFKQINLSC